MEIIAAAIAVGSMVSFRNAYLENKKDDTPNENQD